MNHKVVALLAALAVAGLSSASAETVRESAEGGMDIEITYPDTAIIGRDFPVSFLIHNNGWEDKERVVIRFDPDDAIVPVTKNSTGIEKIAAGGSYGDTVDFAVLPGASAGIHFLNLDYSQVLLENNETPRPETRTNIAIALDIREQARVSIHAAAPESIFARAEFPFTVEVLSEDVDLRDVHIEIIAPKDIEFRGETLHVFSSVKRGETLGITSRIITPAEEVQAEYSVPFQILVSYDDAGKRQEDSQTVSLTLRPRSFMELTTDGGIWIGGIFIAPYISLGTIIGIPAGAVFSLLIKKRRQKPREAGRT